MKYTKENIEEIENKICLETKNINKCTDYICCDECFWTYLIKNLKTIEFFEEESNK